MDSQRLKNQRLEVIAAAIEPMAVAGALNRDVAGVTCDSRQVRPDVLFVAVAGAEKDGWAFVNEAIRRGAAVVVSEHEPPMHGAKQVTFIRVANARLALARAACRFYDEPARVLKMTGITGTNGKTTTAYLIAQLFEAAGWLTGLISTIEYRIGTRSIPASQTTPDAPQLQLLLARMVTAGCRCAVMEVSSHSLDQHRVAGIDYDVAIFTNLTRDHLDYHCSMESYFEAKRRLFETLGHGDKPAIAVINRDDEWGRKLPSVLGGRAAALTYGMDSDADVMAENISLSTGGTVFTVCTPWGKAAVRLGLMGRHNVNNALAALATGGVSGISLENMAAQLALPVTVPGRLQAVANNKGFQVFVDYAHTDDALANVLGALREVRHDRLLVLFGCGGNRDTGKRAAMGAVAARWADYTVLTSDNPRKEDPGAIIAQIQSGFADAGRYEVIVDREQAIGRILELAKPGDIVLIAGKGHETYQEFADKKIPFDDRDVARRILEAL